MGQEKQVSLAQPDEPLRPNLSRRDEARLKAQQRREERALRREESRMQMVGRRQQEQLRREEMRAAVERSRPQEADDDDDVDERPIITRRERPFDLPFFGIFR
jgi:hypothetical protein